MSVRRICEAIILNQKSILPVSHMQHGAFGIDDVAISMPAIIGKDGIEAEVPIRLNETEQAALVKSSNALKAVIESIEI